MELVIGKATYTLRDNFKGRDGWLAYQKASNAWPDDFPEDYDAIIKVLCAVVTAWSLGGQPSHAKLWADVDAPHIMKLFGRVMVLMEDARKNSPD